VIIDFGQNLVGWVRLTVEGTSGQELVLRHAEVLEHGELGTRPLRGALATDRFILSGKRDTFEPRFTFHGFRYVEITGLSEDLDEDDIVAVVVHSDMKRTGHFRTSNPKLNRLHENVVWGTRGNFLDVPTDCPQRDERLGWTGDIAVFAPTAAFLFDVEDFLRDWLIDLAHEQMLGDGEVPLVVPNVFKHPGMSERWKDVKTVAIWSDAAVWVPWALWETYGERTVLRDQFDSMKTHVDRVASLLSPDGVWDQTWQLGDWLDPTAPPERPEVAQADPAVVATACAARSAAVLAETAHVLDYSLEYEKYRKLSVHITGAFQRHYISSSGRIVSDCATVYALAIAFGLLTEEQQDYAGSRLAELVRENEYRIATGFAGTPFVAGALSATGHDNEAYRLVLEEEPPSWMYAVNMGATTIWERWDSMLPDGTINPDRMTSFNHYALGSIAQWMHQVVGGIELLEPGYSRVRIAPRPPGAELKDAVTWAETSLMTQFGQLRVAWQRANDESSHEFALEIDVPPGVAAEVDLPGSTDRREIDEGSHQLQFTVPEETHSL